MTPVNPCQAPLSSIPERLRGRDRPARAPSVGSLPVPSHGLLPLSRVRNARCAAWAARTLFRRGRSFCLRVCGCAPSAVRQARFDRLAARSPDACGECTRGQTACQFAQIHVAWRQADVARMRGETGDKPVDKLWSGRGQTCLLLWASLWMTAWTSVGLAWDKRWTAGGKAGANRGINRWISGWKSGGKEADNRRTSARFRWTSLGINGGRAGDKVRSRTAQACAEAACRKRGKERGAGGAAAAPAGTAYTPIARAAVSSS